MMDRHGRGFGRCRRIHHRVLTAMGMIVAVAGCETPVKTTNKHRPEDSVPPAERHPIPMTESPDGRSPVTRMRVQGETVEAIDLWNEIRDELDAKYRSLSPAQFRGYVRERSVQLITDKIAEILLYQRARLRMPEGMEKKVEEYADGEIRKIVTADYGGVQRRFERKLEQQGRTLESVRRQIQRQIVISGYLDAEIRPQIAEPTRAQLQDAYRDGLDQWRESARRSMSLIDVRIAEFLPRGVSEPSREHIEYARTEARKRIEAAAAELRSGADFADVAKKYSQGSHAEEGGAWGWITSDEVRERFLPAIEALNSLDAGEVSPIIETPDAFFLVRCDEYRPATVPDFQSIQLRLRDEAFRREFNRKVSELVFELRKTARIEPENLELFHEGLVAAALRMVGSSNGSGARE